MDITQNNNEEKLIKGLIAGNQTCYAELIEIYGGRMLSVARRFLPVNEDAQDCVQEAFLQIFKKIETLKKQSSLWPWMRRIVVNQCLMKIRSRKNTPQHEDLPDEFIPEFDNHGCRQEPQWFFSHSSIEILLNQNNTKDLIIKAINQLPENYRIILMLRDIDEYTTKETAKALNLSIGAVKTRLHRARAALKILLEPLFKTREDS